MDKKGTKEKNRTVRRETEGQRMTEIEQRGTGVSWCATQLGAGTAEPSVGLCGQGANLKEHLWTMSLWWQSTALLSLASLTLAFDRPLEVADGLPQVVDRMGKGADKFLLAEEELRNWVLPFEAVFHVKWKPNWNGEELIWTFFLISFLT